MLNTLKRNVVMNNKKKKKNENQTITGVKPLSIIC